MPIHVAASRHCSPAKLNLLLAVYPGSINALTESGETPLSLAKSTATKSHPNNRLIQALEDILKKNKMTNPTFDSNTAAKDSSVIGEAAAAAAAASTISSFIAPVSPDLSYLLPKKNLPFEMMISSESSSATTESDDYFSNAVTGSDHHFSCNQKKELHSKKPLKKRSIVPPRVSSVDVDPVGLLLNFSRGGIGGASDGVAFSFDDSAVSDDTSMITHVEV